MADSAIARLRPSLADVVHSLRRDGRVGRAHVDDVVAILIAAVEAYEGRARAAEERSRERSAAIRAAIRVELEHFAIERPGLTARELTVLVRRRLSVRANEHGLKCAPSLRLIRDEINRRDAKSKCPFGSETTREPRYGVAVAST